MNFITRLKLAYKVFKMEPFDTIIESWHDNGTVKQPECDGTWESYKKMCTSGEPAKYCLTETVARFEIDKESDHFHCCEDCREKVLAGKIEYD